MKFKVFLGYVFYFGTFIFLGYQYGWALAIALFIICSIIQHNTQVIAKNVLKITRQRAVPYNNDFIVNDFDLSDNCANIKITINLEKLLSENNEIEKIYHSIKEEVKLSHKKEWIDKMISLSAGEEENKEEIVIENEWQKEWAFKRNLLLIKQNQDYKISLYDSPCAYLILPYSGDGDRSISFGRYINLQLELRIVFAHGNIKFQVGKFNKEMAINHAKGIKNSDLAHQKYFTLLSFPLELFPSLRIPSKHLGYDPKLGETHSFTHSSEEHIEEIKKMGLRYRKYLFLSSASDELFDSDDDYRKSFIEYTNQNQLEREKKLTELGWAQEEYDELWSPGGYNFTHDKFGINISITDMNEREKEGLIRHNLSNFSEYIP